MSEISLKSKLRFAASAVILGGAVSGHTVVMAQSAVDEIIVTATKKSESLQDVSIAITALPEEVIEEYNIQNFDDYVRYLPGVNAAGRGPGQSSIFIRGAATDSSDQTSVEIGAPVPNVALYLDEQPVSSGGRNLDVYAADIQRIEVLPGPQGTLFGANSQAGTVRLVTNKPNYDEYGGGFDLSVSSTKGGEFSNSAEAVINIPIVKDKLAIRGVVYNSFEGGYIDNVFGEATFEEGDTSFPTGATTTTVNNLGFIEEDFNDTTYQGFRLSAGWQVNENWEVVGQYMNQRLEVDGVFDHSPEELAEFQVDGEPNTGRIVGDLQVQRFFEDSLDDQFEQFALTVKGRLGALDLVYAGGFLDREVNNSFDYTGYSGVGGFGYYYLCQPTYTACGSPVQGVIGLIENKRSTHEVRASYEGERVSLTGGLYIDDIETQVDVQFVVPASVGFFAPNGGISTTTQFNPDLRPEGVTFVSDATRGEEQIALFGEFKLDLVPDTLSATIGARYYNIETELLGSSSFATLTADDAGVAFDGPGGVFTNDLPLVEEDVVFKGTVEYTPNSDVLLYATYSEGFRPGGFNRTNEPDAPLTYVSDTLVNYELGWKTTFLDGAIRFNGAAYFIDWSDIQVGITDISLSPPITFTANAGEAEIFGVEADLVYAVNDNLTLFGALSYNNTEIVGLPTNVDGITPLGSNLALAPELQFNTRARYEWEKGDYNPYAQVVFSYTSSQFSSIVEENRFPQDSYIGVDASVGVTFNDIGLEAFVENLTDERAQLFINSLDTDLRITTNRPRTVGIRASYDF